MAVSADINEEMLLFKPSYVPSTTSWKDVVKCMALWAIGIDSLDDLPHNIVGFPLGYEYVNNFISPEFVEYCHKKGKQVWVFGPGLDNTETQTYAWNVLRVDGIFVDIPDVAIEHLRKLQQQNSV